MGPASDPRFDENLKQETSMNMPQRLSETQTDNVINQTVEATQQHRRTKTQTQKQ